MIVYYCFLEVFNEEIGKWEQVKSHNLQPEDLHYGEFFTKIDRESLFFFFQDLENQQEAVLFPKWKGLPNDASNYVKNQHDFLFEEVSMCNVASYLNLNELIDFDYSTTFNLYKLPKWEYKNFKEYNYKEKLLLNKKQISYKNYLGNAFFEDLNFLKQFERFGKCRIIYFVDSGNRWRDYIVEFEPYFKRNNQTKINVDITEDDYGQIEFANYQIISSFIEKNTIIEKEEVIEKLENLGIQIRDIFLNYLEETIPIAEYNIDKAQLTQRFWILEKLFAFGYHNGEVNNESIGDFCGQSPIFKNSVEETEYFTNHTTNTIGYFYKNRSNNEVEVDCGRYAFKSLFEFEKFKLILRGFCDKWEREIEILSCILLRIKKTDNYEKLLVELKDNLKK